MACESPLSLPAAVSPPPLRNRKFVVKKVEPSYISSDLFTPFSDPRPTLPSIGEFVRPSYNGDTTWGATTNSYGGVGPAAQRFKENGCGSISRSHRHYGSGCINYTNLDYTSDNPRPHQLKRVTFQPVHRAAAGEEKFTTSEQHHPVTCTLSSGASAALKAVRGSLYGTSSYNTDFTSVMKTFQERRHSNLPPITSYERDVHRKEADKEASASQEHERKEEETQAGEEECDEEGEEAGSEGHTHQEDEDDDGNVTSHGHMICVPNYITSLPDHVIVTDLSDLPVHFRRVTTKYTRNRCPLFPCRVPFYLQRQHQLLPSVMTSLSSTMTSPSPGRGDHEATDGGADLVELHQEMKSDHHDKGAMPIQDLSSKDMKLPEDDGRLVAMETTSLRPQQRPLLQELKGHTRHSTNHVTQRCRHSGHVTHHHLRRCGHVTQHLGIKFKTEAHVRYHTLFPDHAPSLQTLEPSRRHSFYGYHASVFRG